MRELDLNIVNQPTMAITLPGAEKKRLVLTTPTVKCIERLRAIAPELERIFRKDDEKSVNAAYNLAADLMSCNTASEKITAKALKTVYGITQAHLLAFYAAYVEFMAEVKSSKN